MGAGSGRGGAAKGSAKDLEVAGSTIVGSCRLSILLSFIWSMCSSPFVFHTTMLYSQHKCTYCKPACSLLCVGSVMRRSGWGGGTISLLVLCLLCTLVFLAQGEPKPCGRGGWREGCKCATDCTALLLRRPAADY